MKKQKAHGKANSKEYKFTGNKAYKKITLQEDRKTALQDEGITGINLAGN